MKQGKSKDSPLFGGYNPDVKDNTRIDDSNYFTKKENMGKPILKAQGPDKGNMGPNTPISTGKNNLTPIKMPKCGSGKPMLHEQGPKSGNMGPRKLK